VRRKSIFLVAGTVVLVLVLSPTSGAISEQAPEARDTSSSSTHATAAPSSLVGTTAEVAIVQRGRKNYAGPDCPGVKWNCTTARYVIQIATDGGKNESECSPSGEEGSSDDRCVIVQQADGGTNLARCIQTSHTKHGPSQETNQVCDITQSNTTGKNSALVRQYIMQKTDTKQQDAFQETHVKQTNGSGTNYIQGSQSTKQSAKSEPSGAQIQNAHQSFTVDQDAETGINDQSLRQRLVQDARMKSKSENGPGGSRYESSSQTQSALLESFVNQNSEGVSRGHNRQRGTQKMSAPPATTQVQDPRIRCCADQSGNPDDVFKIDQRFVQLATHPTSQFGEDVGRCLTKGICTIIQRARQNDEKKTNFATGTGLVTASIVCRGYGEVNRCVAESSSGGKED
jgi:hypothetical protein